MGKMTVDPKNPPRFTPEQLDRLRSMTPEEIEANALSDPDNLPLTEAELRLMEGSRLVKAVRARTGLSQPAFAETYKVKLARLRDLEQGRTAPDSAMTAYLRVIARDPDYVRNALGAGV